MFVFTQCEVLDNLYWKLHVIVLINELQPVGRERCQVTLDMSVENIILKTTPPSPPTCSPLARLIFPAVDDNLLRYNYDDNQRVEPEWYIPILPMVLVNGVEGIGTGWASKIPNFDVKEVITNLIRMLDGEDPQPMVSRTFK